ncbi:MAG: hypothetical protein VYA99_07785, partial [Pseudomonadota bacterium]|nr:hypothetical protein [Pseudomonadota bacterium]
QLPMNIPITSGLVKDDQVKLVTSSVDWLEQPAETLNQNQRISAAKIATGRAPTKNINGTRRWQYVNLRVNAEFLVFLAHSGMNVSEAASLRKCSFKYKSSGDSWIVRSYKNRRGGEVEFTIYKSYKLFLENHLKFIRYFFPESPWLFPIISQNGLEIGSRYIYQYKLLKTFLSKYKIPWISPKTLRKTRVNWLLRRSGDENLTAEMAQHTINVLRGQYERPSQQRAMVEITRFWTRYDPIKKNQLKSSVIASDCNGIPKALPNIPHLVVKPNCINPSGCLWCKHHRDSDTADYVWSLTSMRHLKCIEAGDSKSRNPIAADDVIDRLSEKINWYRNSNDIRKSWTEEAEQRIKEGYYHPNWKNIIEFLE